MLAPIKTHGAFQELILLWKAIDSCSPNFILPNFIPMTSLPDSSTRGSLQYWWRAVHMNLNSRFIPHSRSWQRRNRHSTSNPEMCNLWEHLQKVSSGSTHEWVFHTLSFFLKVSHRMCVQSYVKLMIGSLRPYLHYVLVKFTLHASSDPILIFFLQCGYDPRTCRVVKWQKNFPETFRG